MTHFISRPSRLLTAPDKERRSLAELLTGQRMLAEAIAFQEPIDEICEQPAPLVLRSIHYLVAGLLVTLLVVAAVTKVDIVVLASGRLTTASPPIMLQPMERGILREVRVHPGDIVTKGEVLATLDPTFAEADTTSLQKQMHSLQVQLRRLQAEAEGHPFVTAATPTQDEMLQATLYQQRQNEYTIRLRVFDEEIRHLQASLQESNDDRSAFGREVGVAKSVEQMRSTLQKMQVGSRLSMLEAQANRMRSERDQQDASNRAQQFQHDIAARIAERQAFVDGWHRELLDTQVGVRKDIAQVTAELAKASRLNDLVTVTAPANGVVLEVAQRTAGSVLREAEPLVTIIPDNAPMIAEVTIASSDVGDAIPGADVKLKVDAFPYQRHGMLTGRLLSVSEESYSPDGKAESAGPGAVHRGRVELTDTRLDSMNAGARLLPGMTLSAEIKAGTRSVLSYFLYPFTRGLRESIREP